jgi:predicted acetyltransferase
VSLATAVTVDPAAVESRPVLRNLVQLYLHDLSATGGWDVDETGTFQDRLLDGCWSEPRRHPFLFHAHGTLAGFAIVDRGSQVTARQDVWDMAEFFVLNRWRRSGVGRSAAEQLFAMFPGEWEVRPFPGYVPAQRFWTAVCGAIASSDAASDTYRRSPGNIRPVIRFSVA